MQVAQASRIGGKHSYEFMKRNLSKLLSDKLAERYSWLGKKQKQKFHELKLAEMLIGKQLILLCKLIHKLEVSTVFLSIFLDLSLSRSLPDFELPTLCKDCNLLH